MIVQTFVCERHPSFGDNGFRPKSQPGFDPLGGMAVAHDVLEHFPNTKDDPAAEFLASGASVWVRGDQFDTGMGRPYAPRDLASDVPEVFHHVFSEGMSVKTPPPARPLTGDHEWAEDYIDAVVKQSRKLLAREYAYEIRQHGPVSDDLERMRAWMRIGYRKARRRYAGMDRWRVFALFVQIDGAAERALKYATEGGEFRVSVSPKRCVVKTRYKDPWELNPYD